MSCIKSKEARNILSLNVVSQCLSFLRKPDFYIFKFELMHWSNIETLVKKSSEEHNPHSFGKLQKQEWKQPQPRWGQAMVEANKRLYIIGGYEGKSENMTTSIGNYLNDVWEFNF